MSEPRKRSQWEQTCMWVFMIGGAIAFESVGSSLFVDPAEQGFNLTRLAAAGAIGGLCALVGSLVGHLIDSLRRR